MKKFKKILLGMITNQSGGISSKIIIGAISYLILIIAIVILIFVNPSFPGISDIINVLIITSASLLGLTTVENINQNKK